MQEDVFTIFCFSEMSLPISDIFNDYIILTLPHELSADNITRILKLTCKLQHQGLWSKVNSISDATDDYFHT